MWTWWFAYIAMNIAQMLNFLDWMLFPTFYSSFLVENINMTNTNDTSTRQDRQLTGITHTQPMCPSLIMLLTPFAMNTQATLQCTTTSMRLVLVVLIDNTPAAHTSRKCFPVSCVFHGSSSIWCQCRPQTWQRGPLWWGPVGHAEPFSWAASVASVCGCMAMLKVCWSQRKKKKVIDAVDHRLLSIPENTTRQSGTNHSGLYGHSPTVTQAQKVPCPAATLVSSSFISSLLLLLFPTHNIRTYLYRPKLFTS